jgi:hypothetical protein
LQGTSVLTIDVPFFPGSPVTRRLIVALSEFASLFRFPFLLRQTRPEQYIPNNPEQFALVVID